MSHRDVIDEFITLTSPASGLHEYQSSEGIPLFQTRLPSEPSSLLSNTELMQLSRYLSSGGRLRTEFPEPYKQLASRYQERVDYYMRLIEEEVNVAEGNTSDVVHDH